MLGALVISFRSQTTVFDCHRSGKPGGTSISKIQGPMQHFHDYSKVDSRKIREQMKHFLGFGYC
jgi:D-mannonate dehydratase